jgi:spore coat polysaccharide biosynthesis predicted glycosyltransferase SpsG
MEKIAFYAEANKKIGIGHLVRLKNLQKRIKNKKIIWFYSGDKKFAKRILKSKYYLLNKKNSNTLISSLDKILKKEKISKIFLDIAHKENLENKKIFENFFKRLKKKKYFLISFDDPRLKIFSDISIIPYLFDKKKIIIKNKEAILLHGKEYFFSSSYFDNYRGKIKIIKKNIKKIFIFLTGYNKKNIIKKILKEFAYTKYKILIYAEGLKINNNNKNIKLVGFKRNVAKLYFDSDISIVGEGLSRYEASLLGVPTILIYNFENLRKTNDLAWKFINLNTSKLFKGKLGLDSLKIFIERVMTYKTRLKLFKNATKNFDLNGFLKLLNVIKKIHEKN